MIHSNICDVYSSSVFSGDCLPFKNGVYTYINVFDIFKQLLNPRNSSVRSSPCDQTVMNRDTLACIHLGEAEVKRNNVVNPSPFSQRSRKRSWFLRNTKTTKTPIQKSSQLQNPVNHETTYVCVCVCASFVAPCGKQGNDCNQHRDGFYLSSWSRDA